jgi:uncharacterized protein (TIGR02118 family)
MVVKILVKVYAKEGKSRDEVLNYWLTRHGPLMKKLFGDKMKKYVISIVMSAEGEEPGYLGTVEQWFDNMTDLQTMMSSTAFKQQIMPDHANFARKVTWLVLEEHTMV